jgi:hypothetical protein
MIQAFNSRRRSGFDPRPVCVGFVLDRLALGSVLLRIIRVPLSLFHQYSIIMGLRRRAIILTVPGSIPGVTGFFSDIFPSDRTMALRSTQPPVKMSTRNIPGGKGGRCVRVMTSPPLSAECHWKSGSLNLLEPSGPHRACYGTPLPFLFTP